MRPFPLRLKRSTPNTTLFMMLLTVLNWGLLNSCGGSRLGNARPTGVRANRGGGGAVCQHLTRPGGGGEQTGLRLGGGGGRCRWSPFSRIPPPPVQGSCDGDP